MGLPGLGFLMTPVNALVAVWMRVLGLEAA